MLEDSLYKISQTRPGQRLLIPLARTYLRFFPGRLGKESLWIRWVEPYLAWQSHPFVARTVFGQRLAGDTADMVQQHIYYFGLWEPELTAWISRHLARGDTFVDVGANIGYYALLGSTLVGEAGSVVAIEASPAIFEQLQGNLARNRVRNVRAINIAASNATGAVQLFSGPAHNRGETSLFQTGGSQPEGSIQAAPLSKILAEREVSSARIIKIDAEGAEWMVLQGLRPRLEQCRADLDLIVEIHPQYLAQQGLKPDAIVEFLEEHGFHAYRLLNSYWPFAERDHVAKPLRLKQPIIEETVIVFSRQNRDALD